MKVNGELTARTTKLRRLEAEVAVERERGARETTGLPEKEEWRETGLRETAFWEETQALGLRLEGMTAAAIEAPAEHAIVAELGAFTVSLYSDE